MRQPKKVTLPKPETGEDKPSPSEALPGNQERYRIQVLDRAVHILSCFGFERNELSVSEITARTKLHKATVHRILAALQHNKLAHQNPKTGRYSLGIKLFELGQQAVARLDLREIARPHIEALSRETSETVHLAILDENKVLYLEKVEGPHALRMPSRVGHHIPTYCTSLGKAMLACLDDGEIKRMFQGEAFERFTPATVKSVAELLRDLEAVRKRGYAIDDEEIERGLRCVAAPVRDYTGEMAGAISIAAPSVRLTDKTLASVGRRVQKTAKEISSELGFIRAAAE